jgi:hypothetical protein
LEVQSIKTNFISKIQNLVFFLSSHFKMTISNRFEDKLE